MVRERDWKSRGRNICQHSDRCDEKCWYAAARRTNQRGRWTWHSCVVYLAWPAESSLKGAFVLTAEICYKYLPGGNAKTWPSSSQTAAVKFTAHSWICCPFKRRKIYTLPLLMRSRCQRLLAIYTVNVWISRPRERRNLIPQNGNTCAFSKSGHDWNVNVNLYCFETSVLSF